MKNALILHGTDGDHSKNWFPWLDKQLENHGYKVWTPDLPEANQPNIGKYNTFIFNNKSWHFDQDSILIGHSSGAVAILGLLQALPENIAVDTCYLVGAFKDDLGWDSLKELFVNPFDYEYIKTKAKHFIFIHSDNDPYCPLEHAEFLVEKIDGQLIVKKGQKHFSVGTMGESYKEFPFLLQEIMRNERKHLYQFRTIQPKDFEIISEIIVTNLRHYYADAWDLDDYCSDYSPENISKMDLSSFYVVTDQTDTVIASGQLTKNELKTIFVSQDHQHQGIGRFVVEQLEKILKSNGYASARVLSGKHAINFYEKLGYQKTGRTFAKGEDIEMEKSL